jgi:RNA polymerase sigma-70 factor (ECF subfamily)
MSERCDVSEQDLLAERFERQRGRLRAVAYRMLGSFSEADDAVQEAWLRLSRADADELDDMAAWLTTVVARICLDALRARARRAVPVDPHLPDPVIGAADVVIPEEQALIADSVGLALLIVLEQLAPSERLAFVLHDIFDVPFEQIAVIVDRSEPATRQLASRARRRVRSAGGDDTDAADLDLAAQWELVDAFIAAARDGDFEALLRLLDPEAVRRLDIGAADLDVPRFLRGAEAVAAGAIGFRRLGGDGRRVLVNGAPGFITFIDGRPFAVVGFTVARGRIAEVNVLADPVRVSRLDLSGALG